MSERDPSTVRRKLAAILSADVQGYSRLMGDDEVATIRTLTAYRELMTRTIQQHAGRVVDSPGDNLLAEFSSVVDAVQCAVEVQTELAVRNAELPADRQMHYRMGINVGDVVVEEERIYGDGVNIAARLESLAEGGGICISGAVHEQIANKLDLVFTYQGEQRGEEYHQAHSGLSGALGGGRPRATHTRQRPPPTGTKTPRTPDR